MSYDPNALMGIARRTVPDILSPATPVPQASPLDPQGLQTQSNPLTSGAAPAPVELQPFEANAYAEGGGAGEFDRGTHQGWQDTLAGLKDIGGALALGVGKRDTATALFKEAKEQSEKAAQEGPHAPSFNDAYKEGHLGDYAAGLAGEAVPTLASMLIPGGIGGKLATKTVEKGAVRAAEGIAAKASERALAQGASEEGAATVAAAARDSAIKRLAPAVKDAAENAHTVGEAVGTTLGGLPGAEAANAEQLANAKPEDLNTTVWKTTLGSLASSAIGAVPATRLLDKAGQEAVQATTEKFLPRVAKEIVKQGSVAGAAGVAQTAATLATHKWVGDNVDLLSPQAFDQYLDSFVGGNIIGSLTGGGLAAFKGAPAPHLDLEGVKGKLKENFDRFSKVGEPAGGEDGSGQPAQGADGGFPNSAQAYLDTHASLKGSSAEAAELFSKAFKHGDDAQQSVLDALTKAHTNAETKAAKQAILREIGKYAGEEVEAESGPDFSSRADEMLDRINQHEQVDQLADDAHASHQRFMQGAEPLAGEAPRYTNPVQMHTPLENMLAAHIPADHPVWQYPDAVQELASSTAKMLSTGEDLTPKDTANLNTMRQLVGDQTMAKWKSVGPEFAKLTEMTKHVDAGATEDATAAKVDPSSLSHDDLTSKLTAAEPGSDEHTALRSELKSRLLDGVITENKKGAGPDFFAAKAALPSTVEIAGVNTGFGPRRRLVDVGNLVGRELANNPGGGKGAIAKVMGDLALAGVKVKPESIKPGTWYTSKDGSSVVKLSPRDAQDLRRQAKTLTAEEKVRAKAKTERDSARLKAPKEEETPEQNAFERSERENASTQDTQAVRPGDVPREEQQHVLAPKNAPPTDKGGGVADVKIHQPYAKLVNKTLAKLARAKTPQERLALKHEAGVRIGRAELEKTEVNDRTRAKKLAALEDASTEHSLRYFRQARRGKFDSSSVTETKADTGAPTSERDAPNKGPESKMRERQEQKPERVATSKGTVNVVRSYDVPLIGSSLKDGTVVLDKDWNGVVDAKRAKAAVDAVATKADSPAVREAVAKALSGYDRTGPVTEHEVVERHAENSGKDYSKSHYDYAEPAEHKRLLADLKLKPDTPEADLAIRAYEHTFKEELVAAGTKKNPDVPPNLLEKPYEHPHNVEQRKMLAEVDAKEGKATEQQGRADDDISVGFKESDKPSKHDYGKETKMVNAVLDRIAFKGPKLTVRAPRAGEKVSGGRWEPKANEIIVADHLTGPERIEVIAHELGHHVVIHELGESLEKATPELRAALVKDFQKWLGKGFSGDAKVSDVLASRKAFFRAMKIRDQSTGLRVSDLDPAKTEYLYDMHEYLADHFSRALTQSEYGQGVVEKFFKGVAQKLRDAYDAMFGGERAEYAPAESVDKWVKSLFDRGVEDVKEATGQSVPRKVAAEYVKAANFATGSGTNRAGTLADSAEYRAHKAYVEHTLSPEERGILQRALDRRTIEAQLRAKFGGDTDLMEQMEVPGDRLATQFMLANKLFGEGKLDLRAKGPLELFLHLRNGLLRLAGLKGNNDKAMQLFIDSRNGDIAAARKGGIEKGAGSYDVDKRVNPGKQLQEAFNAATKLYWSQVFHPFRRIEYGPGSNIHYSYTPALAALGAKLKLHTGEAGNDHGYLPAVETQRHLFNTDAGRALGHLSTEEQNKAHQLLQTRTPLYAIGDDKLRKAVADTRKLMRKALGYARDAGVKLKDYGADYYPTFIDSGEVAEREQDFRALISQPKFEAGLREVLGDNKTPHADLVEKLVDYAKRASGDGMTPPSVDPLAPPEFRSMNTQVFKAIYDNGSPDEVKRFADFQKKSADEVVTPYMHALVKRAEYARRFGDDGAEIKKAFAAARKQGASEKDIKHVEDYIASATGAYGADGSPIVRKLFGDKAGNWFGKPETKAGISMLMAYENVRLLPLALLSSIADPMGIGVRYGGIKSMKDLGQAWKSFNEGFRAMSKKLDKTGLQEQARIIGMADDYMRSDIAVNGYSPGMEGFSRKVSDWMFKVNGLNWFIKSTRYMALSAANAFLLKHAAHLDPKHSTRYLQELGVKPGDIRTAGPGRVKLLSEQERDLASSEERAKDDRVKNALNRFVNEAILRTDASQHPIYMNDPAFRLVTQYKQFAHAFSDQIIDRIIQEAHYSNFHVFGPAVGYIPVTVLGEMTRSFIQYGAAGNPNQQDWDALDWAAFAGNRSGLVGPRVQQGLGLLEGKAYAGMGRMVELGPTGEQLEDVLSTLAGRRSLESTVVESLPAGNVLKHW